MKEQEALTKPVKTAYPRSGEIYMDNSHNETLKPLVSAENGKHGSIEEDQKRFGKKTREKPERKDVEKNAALREDKERLTKARKILKNLSKEEVFLTQEQENAILEAHKIGEGKGSIYNYSRAQIREKAEILNKAGFTKEQRRVLMEAGIVGLLADHETAIQGTPLGSDNELREIKKLIVGDRDHHEKTGAFGPGEADREPVDIRNRVFARAPEIVQEFVNTLAWGSPIDDHILDWMAEYPKYADEFLSKIIMSPYINPTVEYDLRHYGLYIDSNISNLINKMETRYRAQGITDEENQGRHYKILVQAVENYHRMNQIIQLGQIEQYAKIASFFSPDFFEVVKTLPGLAQAKRLYETAYRTILERDGGINNYNFPEVQKMVEDWLQDLNNNGVLETEDPGRVSNIVPGAAHPRRRLEKWELERASNLARTMLSVEFRTAEKISMGDLALVAGVASSPQESATRLTDWFRRMGFKFGVDQAQGGVNLMTRVKEKYRTLVQRKYPWLDQQREMRLKKTNNVSVDDLELAGIFGVRGVWDGYRLDVGVLDQIAAANFNLYDKNGVSLGPKEVSLYDFMKKKTVIEVIGTNRARAIFGEVLNGGILKRKGLDRFCNSIRLTNNEVDPTTGAILRRQGELKEIKDIKVDDILNAAKQVTTKEGLARMNVLLEKIFRPIVDRTSVGLGAWLTSGVLNHPNLYHVREMIWNKVVDYDPLIIASHLSHLEFKDGMRRTVRSLDEILRAGGFANGEKDPAWETLRQKLIIAHEKRMKDSVTSLRDARSQGGIRNETRSLNLTLLSPTELAIVNEIRNQGRMISKDLSLIRFPYAVFLDDVPFQTTGYREMGSEFFRRRGGADLPSFAEAQKAWITLVGKCAEMNPMEDGIKQFEAIIDGTGGVLGIDAAQDLVVDSLFEGYCEFIQQYPWAQSFIVEGVMATAGKPTSQAQEYGGTKAPSYNTEAMKDFLNTSLNHGVLRREGQGKIKIGDQVLLENWNDTYNDFKKRRKATLLHAIVALLKDFFLVGIIAFPINFIKETSKSGK